MEPQRWLSPEAKSGILNLSLFWWLNSLLRQGMRKILQYGDLYALRDDMKSELVYARFEHVWGRTNKSKRRSLLFAVASAFKWSILAPVPARICLIGFNYSQPFLIQRIVDYVAQPETADSKNVGYGLIGATFFIYTGIAVSTGQYQYQIFRSITKVRGALVSTIYRKTLDLNSSTNAGSGAVTLMSTDTDRISKGMERVHEIWASSVETCIAIYLLKRQIGLASIAPLLIALLSGAANSQVTRLMPSRQKIWVQGVQKRVASTASMLSNMKCVKMMGMSDYFMGGLDAQRRQEMALSTKYRLLQTITYGVGNLPLQISAPAAFLIFVHTSGYNSALGLTASQSFTALSIIQLLTTPLAVVLTSAPLFTASLGCVDRVQSYLTTEGHHDDRLLSATRHVALQEDKGYPNKAHEIPMKFLTPSIQEHSSNTAEDILELETCTFGYPAPSGASFTLKEVQLKIIKGSYTMIVGDIGSGKTTLLKAILGETESSKGFVRLKSDGIAYCAQDPWLSYASLRGNIVGHVEFDPVWYATVLRACALDDDIARLPGGDGTIIGSRGLLLSGGQRQRIALARAVYARKATMILDDVLSALDSNTESIVFERLLSADGIFRKYGTTVILATHAVHYLKHADHVVALGKEGLILEQGTFKALSSAGGYIQGLLTQARSQRTKELDKPVAEEQRHKIAGITNPPNKPLDVQSYGDTSVYAFYFRSIGFGIVLPWLSFVIISVFFARFSQIWLQWWTIDRGQRTAYYSSIYFLFGILSSAGLVTYIYWTLMIMIPRSAIRLHWELLNSVIHAPLSFFILVDTGITLNRFSQDMSLLTGVLPGAALYTVLSLLQCAAQIALIAIGARYFATIVPLCLFVTYMVQKFYLYTSRRMRILDLEARSPLYTSFTETVEGLITIRAFGWQSHYEKQNLKLLDASQRPIYLLYCIQRWLNLVLDFIVAGLAIVLVTFAVELRGTTNAGLIGVALVNILGFSQSLSILISYYTALETSLGAVARTKEIVKELTPEDLPIENEDPPPNWPSAGEIRFENVTAAYTSTSPPILNDFPLHIKPGQKIGICGRTGSGKSSLLASLFRLLEIQSGKILIDDVDISHLPRQAVRSRLIAVPQDPFFLSEGSIRLNASPWTTAPPSPPPPPRSASKHEVNGTTPGQEPESTSVETGPSDKEIISALEKVSLWPLLLSRGASLSTPLSSIPLSHGQQQLFCLARALLQAQHFSSSPSGCTPILLLDEATSGLDARTDDLMRGIVEREFRAYTVLTVAHRLGTIRGCDVVVVMDKGRVVECGEPGSLLEGRGKFWEMWEGQR
ncbi:hypothetical protein MMC25_002141 [Agyrium rufum]|nr:hypothetical protein [Agyrium rufum]